MSDEMDDVPGPDGDDRDEYDSLEEALASLRPYIEEQMKSVVEMTTRALKDMMPKFELPVPKFELPVPKFELPMPKFEVVTPAALGITTDFADIVRNSAWSFQLDALLDPMREQLKLVDWTAFLPKIDPSLFDGIARLLEHHLPVNWTGLDWRAAMTFVEETNWAIVWVPRSEVTAELLAGASEDRAITLAKRRVDILEDADDALAEVRANDLSYLAGCAIEVVAAMRDGHDRAAQVLTASVLTGLLQKTLGYKTLSDARQDVIDPREASIHLLRLALILSTVPAALAQYVAAQDPVPTTFNRHALVHTPDAAQLTEVNALVGLMLVVSLLRELQALADDRQRS